MMKMISTIYILSNLILLVFLVNGEKVSQEAIIGEPAILKCNVKGDLSGDNAIMIEVIKKDGSSERLGYYRQQKFIELNSGKGVEFIRKNNIKLYNIDKDIKSYKLDIAKVTMELEGFGFRCSLSADGGLGDKLSEQSIVVKVVEAPKVTVSPEVVNPSLNSQDDVVVTCTATGTPKPTLQWTREGKNEVMTGTNPGELRLKAPILLKYDGAYICTAKVDSKKLRSAGRSEAAKKVNVSVLYKPTLTIEKSTIYTDLDQKENIAINVTGNPMPQLECSLLKLPEPKRIRVTPYATHHRLEYEVTILKVKQKDIRNYTCTASNSQGQAKATVQLILEPSAPIISSKNETAFSDYYQLHWSVKSRAPMHNVTVEIRVRSENGSKLVRTETFKLLGSERSFRHHIANLTENIKHELSIKACNVRACGPINKVPVFFRTMKYDGANTVDPKVVKVPVTVAPSRRGKVRDPIGAAASLRPFFHGVIAVSGMLILLPMN